MILTSPRGTIVEERTFWGKADKMEKKFKNKGRKMGGGGERPTRWGPKPQEKGKISLEMGSNPSRKDRNDPEGGAHPQKYHYSFTPRSVQVCGLIPGRPPPIPLPHPSQRAPRPHRAAKRCLKASGNRSASEPRRLNKSKLLSHQRALIEPFP